MDISFLLYLQHIRHVTQDMWTPFLENLSLFSLAYLLFIPVLIYWCISKRYGLYTLAAFCGGIAANAVLKLTVCAYRPWIHDPRIIPVANAIKTAGGYSFPSGHAVFASTLYGGLAVASWQKKSTRLLSVLCVLLICLTGFSRLYLGVHTPQDVLAGLAIGVCALWGTCFIARYLTRHPQQENKLLALGFLAGILALIYITYKPYPLDYVNGKLLADPHKMVQNGYLEIGVWLGFCVGRYLEKRWIRFTELGLRWPGVLLAVAGLAGAYLLMHYTRTPLVHLLGAGIGRVIYAMFLLLYIQVLFPLFTQYIRRTYKEFL